MKGGAVQQLKARTNPLDAFNDVFAGVHRAAAARRRRRCATSCWSIASTGDYTRLKQNSRLSGDDKQLVDRYVTLVSELQAKLSPPARR